MSQPPPYNRLSNFTDYALAHPAAPYNPSDHDAELNAVETTVDALCTNIALIQRDDGELANETVGIDQLETELRALISINQDGKVEQWTVGHSYNPGDAVAFGVDAYLCVVANVAVDFALDLAAGKWVLIGIESISVVANASLVSFTPVGTISATNVQAAVAEVANDAAAATAAAAANAIPLAQKAAPNGVASLDVTGDVPSAQLGNAVLNSEKGIPLGVATLDATGLVEASQLPVVGGGPFIPVAEKAIPLGVATLDATGIVDSAQLPPFGGPFVPLGSKGIAFGVAELDGTVKVPVAQIPDLSATYLSAAGAAATYIPLTQKGAANGVATLDFGSQIPMAQLKGGLANGVATLDGFSKILDAQLKLGTPLGIPQLDAAGQVPVANLPVGLANGIAQLDAGVKVPVAQLPAGTANGVASLDATGKVPAAQLPAAGSGGGAIGSVVEKLAGFTVTAADSGKLFECSGTFTVAFDALATFAAGFSVWVVNKGTGVVTLDPSGSELIQIPGGANAGELSMTLPYSGVDTGPYNMSGVLLYKNSDATPKWGVAATRETHGFVKVLKSPTVVTITNASPAVVTWNAHGLSNGQAIILTTSGTLPAGLSPSTTYYIVNQATNTFQLSATLGGAAINTTTAGTGTHTATPQWIAPVGVTTAWVSMSGGGGGGGGATQDMCTAGAGGGGASGNASYDTRVSCVPGTAYTATCGVGGTGGSSGAGTGGTGGTTSLGVLLSVAGGAGGIGGAKTSGNGGTQTGVGGMGYAGWSSANPAVGAPSAYGGTGGRNNFGVPVQGAFSGAGPAAGTTNFGSGGGGANAAQNTANAGGGAGAPGTIWITW